MVSSSKLTLFFLACTAWGATRQASSCSVDAVQSAINAASRWRHCHCTCGQLFLVWFEAQQRRPLTGRRDWADPDHPNRKQHHYEGKRHYPNIWLQFHQERWWKRKQRLSLAVPGKARQPVIIEKNDFVISRHGLFALQVAGGVIIAGNSFTGGWDDSFIQPKDNGDAGNSWGIAGHNGK